MLSVDNRNFKERNYIQFGIFLLHTTMLNKNKLLVKYSKSFGPVGGIKQTIISNTLKYLLLDLIDSQKINIELQEKLNLDEIQLFEKLLTKSKLIGALNYKKVQIDTDKLIFNYKKRLIILQGSFDAGNDNDEIINESKELISKLYNLNELSKDNYNMLINIFN